MALSLFNRRNGSKGEMTFMDHLEELRWHITRSVVAILAGAIVVFIKMDFFFGVVMMGPARKDFIAYKWLCSFGRWLGLGDAMCMGEIKLNLQSTVLNEQFMMSFTIAFVGGLVIAFPYVLWEFWRFVRPALTPQEKRKTRGMVFWVSLLFFGGIFFGYFIIAPYTVNFFSSYKLSELIETRPTVSDYIGNIVQLVLGTGLLFQLPLVVYFLSKVGIMTPRFLRDYRKFAIVVILVIAAIITPADVMSMILVTIPLLLLYEISILISARVYRRQEKKEIEEWS
jgi:sec-independent protein translocase protein TatC